MPRCDGTGPMGMGPMTGRKMGICARNNQSVDYIRGMGYGKGSMGYRSQLRAGSNLVPLQQDELSILKNQSSALEAALNRVNGKISELENK